MNIKNLTNILIVSVMIVLASCGGKNNGDDNKIYLSGQLEFDVDDKSGPAFVAISNTDDFEKIENDAQNAIIDIITVDSEDYSFKIDLSETGLREGDEITIFGFIDNDYDSGVPNPTEGDYVGFYFNADNWSTTCILHKGDNKGINIKINRRVYSFNSRVKGKVFGNYSGELTLIAYAGELNSLDFDDFNFDEVIGYSKQDKGDGSLDYTLNIMPYGYDVPIENVFIIAMLDRNINGKPDSGDIIGFHTADANGLPTLVTINEGTSDNKHIDLVMEILEPSGYDKPISGCIEMPGEDVYNENSKPVYLMIAATTDPAIILDEPMDSIKYFEKIVPPEGGTGKIEFNINLSETDLKSGDEIFILALWDKDFTAGFPYPSEGDYIGFYIDSEAMSPGYRLQDGNNKHICFKMNRIIYSFDSEIKGTVSGDATGDLTIIAYAGEINSFDFKNALDLDAIIGYQMIKKDELETDYSLKILPYGFNVPIENVYLIAFLDRNGNQIPDGGDVLGFYSNDVRNLPSLLTVHEGTVKNKHIELTMDLSGSSGYNNRINGSFEMPEGVAYSGNSKPVYLIIAETDDPTDIIENPVDTIKYYEKVLPPEPGLHVIQFSIDLSGTDLDVGDEVFITALWDRDFDSGFPDPTEGDYIGFYMDSEAMTPTYKLKDGANDEIEINLNRMIYSYNAEVSGTVTASIPGDLTIIAYAGEINSLDFTNAIDLDAVIGYQVLPANGSPMSYTLPILPYGYNVPIQDVYIIAFLDLNGNGVPDSGDMIGFHTGGSENNLPGLISVNDGTSENIDIQIMMEINETGGYVIPLRGTIDLPEGEVYDVNSLPIFLIIAETDDPARLLDDPVNEIKYFERVTAPEDGIETIEFDIDLSGTDLLAGDEILVMALWDRDFTSGFPFPTGGDYIGFYMNIDAMSPTYKLHAEENEEISFRLDRMVFDYEASVSGRVCGNDSGEIMIIAYAGALDSLDFKDIDFDAIIGYQKLLKGEGELLYNLGILPYGYDVPIQDVYIIAFLDKNGNGVPDGGDKIGFYIDEQLFSESGMQMPGLLTIPQGDTLDIDIQMLMDVTDPSPDVISISGQFERPAGYHEGSTEPVFIIVAKPENNDPNEIFNDPLNSIKQYYRMPQGENAFNIDLSKTDLVIGDDVFVIAIWDRDFESGFPNPTPGDYVGYLQNKDEFSFTINLQEGVNNIPSGGYEFNINKLIYEHNSSITFGLERGTYDLNNFEGGSIIVVAFQSDDLDYFSMELDMDYIIGTITVEPLFVDDYGSGCTFNMPILPAIYEGINVEGDFGIQNVYIVCIYDSDNDGKPESGDLLGFYYTSGGFFIPNTPRKWYLTDGENILNKTVLFTTFATY